MMGHVMFMRKGDVHTVPENVAVGTIWRFTSNGTFTVPAIGKYQVEIHGGGGGAAGIAQAKYRDEAGSLFATGGGSGELYETALEKGQQVSVTVGTGGAGAWTTSTSGKARGGTGGASTFGSLSCAGGGGGYVSGSNNSDAYYEVGKASGSLSSGGSWLIKSATLSSINVSSKGEGNTNNKAQSYGDGGVVSAGVPKDGQPGAVIVTYLGKE